MDSASTFNLTILNQFDSQPQTIKVSAAILLVVLVALWDLSFGHAITLSMFYSFPVSLAAFFSGQAAGVSISLLSVLVWLAADMFAGVTSADPLVALWNSLIRVIFFLTLTKLWVAFRKLLDRERDMARTDTLTGAINSRHFHEILEIEIARIDRNRRPLTLAFMDLDHFKSVNDRFGHSEGDKALRIVVESLRAHVRKTDVVARLGGDEFVLLLPETPMDQAREVISKLRSELLRHMQSNDWPITFSIGVITCSSPPPSPDALVNRADELMYSVKHGGRNQVAYADFKPERGGDP